MLALLFAFQAQAADAVVTVATDLVAGAPVRSVKQADPWVPVLADCLEERLSGQFAVVDRSRPGLTASTLHEDVAGLRALKPRAVVIGVGSHVWQAGQPVEKAKLVAFQDTMSSVIKAIRADGGPEVFLVGLIGPTLTQVPGLSSTDQVAADDVVKQLDTGLSQLASADDGVWHIALFADWPHDADRATLTANGFRLTDQAHARVGAVICEEILAKLENRSR